MLALAAFRRTPYLTIVIAAIWNQQPAMEDGIRSLDRALSSLELGTTWKIHPGFHRGNVDQRVLHRGDRDDAARTYAKGVGEQHVGDSIGRLGQAGLLE